jgi:hypothetical protein
MAFRVSPPLLSLDTATRDFQEAEQGLRSLLLSAEDLRIQIELASHGAPDISVALATLSRRHRFDACKRLIAAYESYVEAQVNLHLAMHREDYERVVGTSEGPEYLQHKDEG